MPKTSRIMKVAGLSFVGFCAVSLAADKASLAPAAAQAAGFCGAFLGALVGRGKARQRSGAANVPIEPVELGKVTEKKS